VRDEFMRALRRVAANASEPPDSPLLRAYPLYDYLIAARLERDLVTHPGPEQDLAIDAFLEAHSGQPLSRRLRREWLASLAVRQRWDWFLPRSVNVSDPALACDRLAGRLAIGDTDRLALDALGRWLSPQPPPPECKPVYAWLRARGLLSGELADQRTRAALNAGNVRLAKEFIADVPAERAVPLWQWIRLLESPRTALEDWAATPEASVEADALVAGFGRLAYTDSAAAARLLPALLARLEAGAPARAKLEHAAALGTAYDHDAQALALFANLPAEAVDGPVQEWRVRAALWAGDYRKALAWLNEMPAALAAQPRWRYWRARVVDLVQGDEAAAPLFAEIAGLRDYYGYLAADRLQRPYDLNVRPSPDDAIVQAELARQPGLVRARELVACDMIDDAAAEWAVVVGSADSYTKIQAAHLAANWGWYNQAIATFAEAGEWDDVRLRYPRPYAEAIAAAEKATRIPADWILSVMRQESLFRKDAVSRANARGLMQMQPATASAVARRARLELPSATDALFDPAVAVRLGALHLRELLDRFQGELSLALCAYNAGPEHVVRWLPPEPMDADIWIENLPFGETRSYVEHIVEHIVAYAWVRGEPPPRLNTLLPAIEPVRALAEVRP
jgi:soluble lytic murein transglycosylase